MAAAFIAAGTGIAALAAGGGYIQMESGKKENQVRISLDFSGDREFGKYMEDIGAVQVDLALETPEPEDITRAEFTFEASIQKDPDVKIRDGIFLEDTGRFSIFLAGNGTGDGLFNGGKKLELGVLQTASTEDITLRVERIAAAAGEELVFETDGGRENEFLLRATDPGEDQERTAAPETEITLEMEMVLEGKMETAEIPETKGVPGMTAPAAMETALTEILAMAREITAVPGMDPETAPAAATAL